MRRKVFLSLASAAAVVAAGLVATAAAETQAPAQAQAQCSARRDLVEQLSAQYGEKPEAIGQVDQQSIVEIFVSDQGTWTILVTGTDGGSCILATGEGWDSNAVTTAAALHGA